MHNLDNQTIFDTSVATQAKVLLPQSFIEVEKVISNQPSKVHPIHSHKHYEIYFLTKGSRRLLFANSLYSVEAPAIVIIPPNRLHATEGGPFERYNVDASEVALDPFQLDIIEDKQLRLLKPTEKQAQMLTELLDEIRQLDPLKKHNNIAFNTLFSYYLYSIGKLEEDTENIIEHKSDFVPSLVLNIISYLKEKYKEPITLDSLSKKFSVSKATLIYNFNKYLHSSPVDYLINIRIQQAKIALSETNRNLTEIAESCGFSNANYFSLMFKRKIGLSPANYRKYQREK